MFSSLISVYLLIDTNGKRISFLFNFCASLYTCIPQKALEPPTVVGRRIVKIETKSIHSFSVDDYKELARFNTRKC